MNYKLSRKKNKEEEVLSKAVSDSIIDFRQSVFTA